MTDFDKNTWQTPKYVFNAMDRKYRFDLDACANADNALCPRFVTESDDITKNATQSAVNRTKSCGYFGLEDLGEVYSDE
ncbi:phage N-6-adenine-methyltransferase [Aggregatibacter actinomycetemcomitans]|uniref:phage N-6-adenine-methyltransferase n=1 Tax=Aggregatibacter actinomycetemcomitans TaxID=714 RepID=UPI001E590AC0|nr:phage N-6-adenine-methyltransferase [Aggregatibacter actinomycetemcomitans]